MEFTLPIYQDRSGDRYRWVTLGAGPFTRSVRRRSELQAQEALAAELRKALRAARPAQLAWLCQPLDVELHRVHLELTLHGEGARRKVSGLFPLIIERRFAGPDRPLRIAYHPDTQDQWYPVLDDEPLADQATLWLQRQLADVSSDAILALRTAGKDSVRPLCFRATPRSLMDELPARRRGAFDDLSIDPLRGADHERGGATGVLQRLGENLTGRAVERALPAGAPRSPYREQLQHLLCGARKRPVILCGPPGCGKTTLIYQWVYDLLEADDFPSHRSLDRAHAVYALSGRRLIAGMSYVGDWQQRCLDLLQDVRHRPTVLYVPDVHLFGRLGRSRDSDSCFADLLRGPLSRGDLVIVGECSREQLQRLEDEAPAFANQFTVLPVEETGPAETLRMLLQRGRELEPRRRVSPRPSVYRSVLELSSAYFPGQALPGKALGLLDALLQAEDRGAGAEGEAEERARRLTGDLQEIGGEALLPILSRRTGLPLSVLSPEHTLREEDVRAALQARVIGQDDAVEAAVDLVLRIKAGLCDPGRPCGVYLLTGPTGVGKTELARALAELLYGGGGDGEERLVRIDMGEYGGHDAASRLLGDGWEGAGEGALTGPLLRRPFCVVLLDEIEKAHGQVLHLLLQLFEDGRLTGGDGRTADFRQAVVIMTSNLGARTRATIGFGESDGAVLADVARAVRDFFPPELFNRIDRVVPFRPLSPAVARGVADKELRRLLGRRGLTERNVFVTVEPAVLDHVTARAFDARDGARSVKRYLEDRVGGLLAAELSRSPPAALRSCRLFLAGEGDGARPAVDMQPMTEAQPLAAALPLEPLLGEPARRLHARMQESLAFVEDTLAGPALSHLSERLREHLRRHHEGAEDSADQVYQLDSMRLSLEQFRDRLLELRGGSVLDDAEELELRRFNFVEPTFSDDAPGKRYRLFSHTAMSPPLRRAGREELLECLAEARFLRRALRQVDDPDEHAVMIVVDLPLGPPGQKEALLLSALASLYDEERGATEQHAVRRLDGSVQAGEGPLARGRAMRVELGRPRVRIALKRVGLGVRDVLRHEQGCHVWRSLAGDLQLCRVRVLPAPPGLRAADAVAADPGPLLPLVRTLRFDPPEPGAAAPLCEVEDLVLGLATTLRVRSLQDAADRMLLLRTGREEQP